MWRILKSVSVACEVLNTKPKSNRREEKMKKAKKILISGGGIAGLTVAYWLHQYGFEPIVIEKAEQIRSEGYMIDFGGTGWDIAHRMGLISQLQASSHDISGILYQDTYGNPTAEMNMKALHTSAGVADKQLVLDRSDLVEVLYHAVKDDVDIRLGCSIQSIAQSEDAATVTFEDGREERFDLVIGADGIHSKVRQLAFGAEESYAAFLGYYAAAFYVPNTLGLSNNSYTMYVEPGRQVGCYALEDGRLLAYLVYKDTYQGYIPQSERKSAICEQFQGTGWKTQALLKGLSDETPIYLDTVTQIKMPTWSKGRVAFIGDAAYCLTLISGQGASMAMAGAYMLAKELSQQDEHQDAFANFERRLRPHIEETQQKAYKFAPYFIPKSRFTIFLTNLIIKLMVFPWFAKFVGKQFNATSLFETGLLKA